MPPYKLTASNGLESGFEVCMHGLEIFRDSLGQKRLVRNNESNPTFPSTLGKKIIYDFFRRNSVLPSVEKVMNVYFEFWFVLILGWYLHACLQASNLQQWRHWTWINLACTNHTYYMAIITSGEYRLVEKILCGPLLCQNGLALSRMMHYDPREPRNYKIKSQK